MTTRPKTQNLEAWRNADLWSDREFEELCCGLTPGGARECTADLNEAGEEIRRAVLAKVIPCICPTDATAGDKLYGHARFFRPVDVIPWAAERFSAFPFAPESGVHVQGRPGPWPWGAYETPLLRILAEAVERWWVRYDPSCPDTAPTNDTVKDWLVTTHPETSDRVAAIMAQILRDPAIPSGPRKS